MNPVLMSYLENTGWGESRRRRMIAGLIALQNVARKGDQPITYEDFAEMVQEGFAPIATGAVLEDIGVFCNAVGWPNVTCFVVSKATGECSSGFTKISSQAPENARDSAWLRYAVYKDAPLVEGD
jgi:hypothetical protein